MDRPIILLALVLFVSLPDYSAQNPKRMTTDYLTGEVAVMDGDLYFVSGFPSATSLQKIDPITGIASTVSIGTYTSFKDLTPVGDRLYFRAEDGACSNPYLAYYSEAGGVTVPTTIEHPDGIPCSHLAPEGSGVIFHGRFPCSFTGEQYGTLWTYSGSTLSVLKADDGTGASSFPLFDITEGVEFVTYAGSHYYASVNQLYRIHPTLYEQDTIATLGPAVSHAIDNLIVYDGELYFSVYTTDDNRDLYSYDGISASVQIDYAAGVPGHSGEDMVTDDVDLLLKDIELGGQRNLKVWDGSDTTSIGFAPSVSDPLYVDDRVYYSVKNLNGHDNLARTDSTGWWSNVLWNTTGSAGSDPKFMTYLNGDVYYYSVYGETGASTTTYPGMYRYTPGLVAHGYGHGTGPVEYVGPCDAAPEPSNEIRVRLEVLYDAKEPGGTFTFTATNNHNSDTVKVTEPQSS
ncbi:MAG: hypothetical protein HKN79_07165, partial [Flavobacteriales bacterium]|nr:hypothetical protein [Flavobacteriales bacterium]